MMTPFLFSTNIATLPATSTYIDSRRNMLEEQGCVDDRKKNPILRWSEAVDFLAPGLDQEERPGFFARGSYTHENDKP
jgi:hypothetical protein